MIDLRRIKSYLSDENNRFFYKSENKQIRDNLFWLIYVKFHRPAIICVFVNYVWTEGK